jgi:hypothetical protein
MEKSLQTARAEHRSIASLRARFRKTPPHDLDLMVPCPNKKCGAAEGEECKGLEPDIVHFARRVKRLLRGIGR